MVQTCTDDLYGNAFTHTLTIAVAIFTSPSFSESYTRSYILRRALCKGRVHVCVGVLATRYYTRKTVECMLAGVHCTFDVRVNTSKHSAYAKFCIIRYTLLHHINICCHLMPHPTRALLTHPSLFAIANPDERIPGEQDEEVLTTEPGLTLQVHRRFFRARTLIRLGGSDNGRDLAQALTDFRWGDLVYHSLIFIVIFCVSV